MSRVFVSFLKYHGSKQNIIILKWCHQTKYTRTPRTKIVSAVTQFFSGHFTFDESVLFVICYLRITDGEGVYVNYTFFPFESLVTKVMMITG